MLEHDRTNSPRSPGTVIQILYYEIFAIISLRAPFNCAFSHNIIPFPRQQDDDRRLVRTIPTPEVGVP